MLWVMAAKHGYTSKRWMTYRQAKELGGQVRGGETSATVVKYGTFTRENELGVEEELPYARAYRVFNADQIEGLPEDYYTRPEAPRDLGGGKVVRFPRIWMVYGECRVNGDSTTAPRPIC